jgi:hypothetical protein
MIDFHSKQSLHGPHFLFETFLLSSAVDFTTASMLTDRVSRARLEVLVELLLLLLFSLSLSLLL